MPITDQLKQFALKTLPGMNNQVEDLDLQDKWVKTAQNCRFEEEPGAVDKRDPVTYFNTESIGSGAVLGLERFYTSSGVTKFIAVHGTSAYVGDDVAGSFTEIRSDLTSGKRCSFEVYKDIIMCSNGYDNIWAYDGAASNVTWELGACKAVLGTAGGNLDATAEYYYAVTFDADAAVNGAVSNTITTDASKKVELTNIPLGPIGTTNRKLYRTEGGGSSLKLLATIADNTTTIYSDDIADASLTTAYPVVTDDMPKGNILKVHRERLFIAGDPSYPNKIYYANPYLPHFIQQTSNLDFMEISPDDNDEIMGIPIQLGMMICVKKNTIRILHITSATSGANPTSWYADDPISFTGSPAQWSITQTPYGIVFLGWDHWYRFDGAQVTPVFDEFDTDDILPSSYSDTVGFMHEGIFLAAYTDATIATQYHNRIMRYNFKRTALGYDLWTSDTISGANCFAAKTGDDESGELYYGDSQNGFIIKAIKSEDAYRLRTKTECNDGESSDIFVGGSENSPYIEIGAIEAAESIPDDVCIFWDNLDTTPGDGWTEITTYAGRLLKLAATYGTTAGGTHTHTYTGDLATVNPANQPHGETGTPGDEFSHRHELSGTSGASEVLPRHTLLRMFYKNNTTTEYVFPIGALVMWDQSFSPTGWESSTALHGDSISNHYLCMKTEGASGLFEAITSLHTHTASGTSGYKIGGHVASTMSTYYSTTNMVLNHRHDYELSPANTNLSTWELDYVSFPLIKKIGAEEQTWQGEEYFAYCLYLGAGAPGNGWAIDDTYDGRYIKIGSDDIKTGDEANGAHVHTVPGTTSTNCGSWGGGDDYNSNDKVHEHPVTATFASGTAITPKSVTFILIKKIIGSMVDYNDAIETTYTNGIWESPSQEINAESLNKLYWNEDTDSTTLIALHTRTGATQSAVETATNITSAADDGGDIEFTLVAHGLVNTDRVVIGAGTTMPTGVVTTILYYVLKTGNDTFKISLTTGGTEIAWTDDGTGQLTFKQWEGAYSDANGSTITSTAGIWLQYLIELVADDTTDSNPRVYFTNAFVVKYTYEKGDTTAETSVNYMYEFGFRNFNTPMQDKFFKKIGTVHKGTQGSFTFSWETNISDDSFDVSLDSFPERWQSYFQDTARGEDINFAVSKNDLYSFRLSELKGVYTEAPMIL